MKQTWVPQYTHKELKTSRLEEENTDEIEERL